MSQTNLHNHPGQLGAVVLCGGRSQRMGFDKASLPFGESTFLEQVINRVQPAVGPIVLVGNAKQDFQSFNFENRDSNIKLAFDQVPDSGPLEGIREGLQALETTCSFAFVTSCDVPLLHTELIPFLLSMIDQHEAVIPIDPATGRVFGMTAVYRTRVHKQISRLVRNNDLRVSRLAEALDSKRIDINELKSVDPGLQSLFNINRLADYRQLLHSQSLEIPVRFLDGE